MPDQPDKILQIFSEVTKLVKAWASLKGIYNFNLGYLNGISIMILVTKAMTDFIQTKAFKMSELI